MSDSIELPLKSLTLRLPFVPGLLFMDVFMRPGIGSGGMLSLGLTSSSVGDGIERSRLDLVRVTLTLIFEVPAVG